MEKAIRKYVDALSLGMLSLLPAVLAAQGAPSGGLPPPEDFIRRPAYRSVTLSPDGRSLAALIPINGRANVALVDLESRKAIALTGQTDDDVVSYRWLGRKVIEATTADLDETGGALRLHQHVLLDVSGQNVLRDLLNFSAPSGGAARGDVVGFRRYVATEVLEGIDDDGYEMIVETIDRNIYGLDAYRFNARTGEKKLLTFESPGDVREFIADHAGQVRIAVSSPRGGEHTLVSYRRTNEDKWTIIRDLPLGDDSFDPIAFDYDNKTLYVRVPSAEHEGRRDIFAFDTETGKLGPRVFEAESRDAGGVVFDPVQRKLIGVQDGSPAGVHWIDPRWRQVQVSIDAVLPGAHNYIRAAKENADRVLVTSETESQPSTFYLLDRKTMSLERVAQAYPGLNADDLSPRRFVRYPARDGLSIPGYLTMPKRPDGAKPPLIVIIHGGPFVGAHHFGYDGESQFFASRGYAVLQPDFRGTIGYGDAFYKAGLRQWGLAMQDDVTDGVQWLVKTGKVDGDRVCLYGASYGGYATLWGLEKEPNMFRCGVAFLAVSDVELMFDVTWTDFMRSERGGDMTKGLTMEIGDPVKDREKMRAVSPARHAELIQAPLLLAYGGTDQRVPLIHGERMRSALDNAHKPYEWIYYDDQKHTFFDPANRGDFYRKVEIFLKKNLAPRPATTASAPSNPTPVQ